MEKLDGLPQRNNPAYVMTYDGNNNMLTLTVTYAGASYRRTMTYDGSDNMLTASAWVLV